MRTFTDSVSSALRQITPEQLLHLGTRHVVYLKAGMRDGAMAFMLYGADGAPVFRPVLKGSRVLEEPLSGYAKLAGLDPSAAEVGASVLKMVEVSRHKPRVPMSRSLVMRRVNSTLADAEVFPGSCDSVWPRAVVQRGGGAPSDLRLVQSNSLRVARQLTDSAQ
jgi:hypothetical protein